MKASKAKIDSFFEPKKLAIAGVSRNEKKFGNAIFRELRKKGFEVLPINPSSDEIEGVKCYSSVEFLPAGVESLLITTPRKETDKVLRQAIDKGIKNIWVQQMSETDSTIKLAEKYQKDIIFNKCVFMYAEPVTSIHKFHRTILKIFGKLYN